MTTSFYPNSTKSSSSAKDGGLYVSSTVNSKDAKGTPTGSSRTSRGSAGSSTINSSTTLKSSRPCWYSNCNDSTTSYQTGDGKNVSLTTWSGTTPLGGSSNRNSTSTTNFGENNPLSTNRYNFWSTNSSGGKGTSTPGSTGNNFGPTNIGSGTTYSDSAPTQLDKSTYSNQWDRTTTNDGSSISMFLTEDPSSGSSQASYSFLPNKNDSGLSTTNWNNSYLYTSKSNISGLSTINWNTTSLSTDPSNTGYDLNKFKSTTQNDVSEISSMTQNYVSESESSKFSTPTNLSSQDPYGEDKTTTKHGFGQDSNAYSTTESPFGNLTTPSSSDNLTTYDPSSGSFSGSGNEGPVKYGSTLDSNKWDKTSTDKNQFDGGESTKYGQVSGDVFTSDSRNMESHSTLPVGDGSGENGNPYGNVHMVYNCTPDCIYIPSRNATKISRGYNQQVFANCTSCGSEQQFIELDFRRVYTNSSSGPSISISSTSFAGNVWNISNNQAPVPGTCAINPVVFNALTFTEVTCSGWVDEDGISSYTFYKASPGSSSLSLISSSNKLDFFTKSFNFTISSGNYDIYVEAMDKYGAVSDPLFVGTVTVNSASDRQCQTQDQILNAIRNALKNELNTSTDGLTADQLAKLITQQMQNINDASAQQLEAILKALSTVSMTDGNSVVSVLSTLNNALDNSISYTLNSFALWSVVYGRIDTPDYKLIVVNAQVTIVGSVAYIVGDFRPAKFMETSSDTFQVFV
uniref:Uncharacterized protein n=1 Tax=Acrobeloides nanus TaxID=290746 RepID=A0A914EHH5_9BILA